MTQAMGIYDGRKVLLLEPLNLPANTPVVIIAKGSAEDREQMFWQKLLTLNLVQSVEKPALSDEEFEPAHITGKPISETIIEERR